MVFVLKPEDNAEKLLVEIQKFLAQRGMKINEEKTKMTASTDEVDFLGSHIYVQNNGKFKSTPSKDNFISFRDKVKRIVYNSNYGVVTKVQKLAPIVRG
jgi:RNA-directed DNA polymerase